jgi:hypothetical protein
MADQTSSGRYQLEVPIDASGIEGFKNDQSVKVLAQGPKGPLASSVVKLDDKGHGVAKLAFAEAPGSIRVILGPQDATDKELTGLNTIIVDVPPRRWSGSALKLAPIIIPPYYWWWWYHWCRTFTICGKVVCPDGSSPVVGATVCAYDVDWWWWYSSSQQIACTTTDINGTFCLKFKWCCGWWPRWYWEARNWYADPLLMERILPVLRRNPDLERLVPRSGQPSIADFRELLGVEAAHLNGTGRIDPAVLARLREPLLRKLPPSEELKQSYIWPWYPWQPPWNDCNPDIIFKVTQHCNPTGDPNVIVDETIWDTRWNIPTTINNLTLVANDQACCVHPHNNNCPGTDCMVLTNVCNDGIANVGGNVGATHATPVGFHNPQGAGAFSDQPYAGAVPITGFADCLADYDYYEFEWMPQAAWPGGTWNPMPVNASGGFNRTYFDAAAFTASTPPYWVNVPFGTQPLASATGTQNVYETPQHYEAHNSPAAWAIPTRAWSSNYDELINWQTIPSFPDGTYYLQLKAWKFNTATNKLENSKVLDICGGQNPNYVVLTVDNRIGIPGPNDVHGQPCTVVHACTQEPDTMIAKITILNGSQYNGVDQQIDACGIYNVKWPDRVRIDFIAYDPDGYLAQYWLNTYYGVNQSRNLLASTVPFTLSAGVPFSGSAGVPAAAQQGPDYPAALAAMPTPATRPIWNGGLISIVLPATDQPGNPTAQGAFPISCCYQLRLDAWKRTIVNCSDVFQNISETSFTINVVP